MVHEIFLLTTCRNYIVHGVESQCCSVELQTFYKLFITGHAYIHLSQIPALSIIKIVPIVALCLHLSLLLWLDCLLYATLDCCFGYFLSQLTNLPIQTGSTEMILPAVLSDRPAPIGFLLCSKSAKHRRCCSIIVIAI